MSEQETKDAIKKFFDEGETLPEKGKGAVSQNRNHIIFSDKPGNLTSTSQANVTHGTEKMKKNLQAKTPIPQWDGHPNKKYSHISFAKPVKGVHSNANNNEQS